MLRISQFTVCSGIVVEAMNSRTRMPEPAAICTARVPRINLSAS
jgi:hypothetical protein